jgi:hypothetical protein
MASYAEDILHAAREASGPSIRDMELIRCFQSHPTTKDAVRVFFLILFNSIFLIFVIPLVRATPYHHYTEWEAW